MAGSGVGRIEARHRTVAPSPDERLVRHSSQSEGGSNIRDSAAETATIRP
jgi:hypothetical protein